MPGMEQVLDVLVALGVARAGGVGVGELVDQADRRPARQDGIDVHLAELHAAVFDDARGDDLEVADLLLGFVAAMGLDQTDDDVHTLGFEPVSLAEHRVGLAHSGRRAEVDLEPAARLPADQVEELLGGRAMEFRRRHGRLSLDRARMRHLDQRIRALALVQGQVQASTLTRGGAPRIAPDRLVSRSIKARTFSMGRPRLDATRGAWYRAASGLMSGSSPEPDAVTRSTGTGWSGAAWRALSLLGDRLAQVGVVRAQVRAAGRVGLVIDGGRPRVEVASPTRIVARSAPSR